MKTRLFFLLFFFAFAIPSIACTTFCLKDEGVLLFGRNYDWNTGEAYLFVNKKNIEKTAMIVPPEAPVNWTSQYGSITFNQFGREFPNGGMNEAGLVVEILWLNDAAFPEPDKRPALNELQWVQYQLDKHSTVKEVIESDTKIRIGQSYSKIHFMISDRSGSSAVIEFLNGKMVAHTGDKLHVPILTNNTYNQSIRYLTTHKGFGGTKSIANADRDGSLDRFVQVADMMRVYPEQEEDGLTYAFQMLDRAAQGSYTKWKIVYNPMNGSIHFKTHKNGEQRNVALRNFDFSCNTPTRMLDMNKKGSGDVSANFVNYTDALNRKLIGNVFPKIPFLKELPSVFLDQIAAYPQTTFCKVKD